MSGNTELQRALTRYRAFRERSRIWLRRYLYPLFRLRVISGVIIGGHHGPLRGAKITLNGWRTVYSDQEGRFTFRFVLKRISYLTVEWREAELVDWIKIDATRQRVSTLKLKWPPLVRGQVIDPNGEPMSHVPVALNLRLITETDAHGTFIFPFEEESNEASDQLVFRLGNRSFVHHFKAKPQEHLLHRFMLSEREGLFHIEDRAAAQASARGVSLFAQRIRKLFWSTIALIFIMIAANVMITHHQKTEVSGVSTSFSTPPLQVQDSEQDGSKWERAGLLERANSSGSQTAKLNASDDHSSRWETGEIHDESKHTDDGELNELALPLCSAFEFTYLNYFVPRGMEGILLSLVFGHWQPWRNGLSNFNGLDRHHELQAGQRVKIKLPISPWSIYQHSGDKSWETLLNKGRCSDDERLCLNLIQAWNPHVSLRRLKPGDQLLINLNLLKRRPFGGATRARIEGLKRGGGPRRKRPRLRLSKACELPKTLENHPHDREP